MTSVLIIGFDYFNTPTENTLPSITDMRYMYDYIRRVKPDKILVITDVDEKDNVSKGIINPNDIYFINNIQSYNEYHFYQDKSDMISTIKNFVNTNHKLVIYYSGHGSNDNILLPMSTQNVSFITNIDNEQSAIDSKNSNKLSFEDLKNIITKYSPKNTQALFLMDCCAGNGLKLPFKMNDNGVYNLKSYNIPTQEIVCISSSLHNQSSISSINIDGLGSAFTKEFFEGIIRIKNNISISYINLIKKIGSEKLNNYDQTLNVYSSRPNLKKVWHWFFSPSKRIVKCENGHLTLICV